MAYKITFEIKGGLKGTLKPLRIRVRNRVDGHKIDIRKNTGIKVEEKHFNYIKQTLSINSPHYKWFNSIQSKAKSELEALHKQEYTVETALTNILNLDKITQASDEVWKNYLAKTKNTATTINNRY